MSISDKWGIVGIALRTRLKANLLIEEHVDSGTFQYLVWKIFVGPLNREILKNFIICSETFHFAQNLVFNLYN